MVIRACALCAVAALLTLIAPALASADGELDPSFGTGGVVLTDLAPGMGTDGASSVILLPDGRIVTGGQESGLGVGLEQQLPDGSLDPSFGNSGKAIRQLSDYSFSSGAVRQPDGALLAAGAVQRPAGFNTLLERFTPSGTIDTSYGNDPPNPVGDGLVEHSFSPDDDFARGIALDSQGRAVITGLVRHNGSPTTSDVLVARFLPDGSLDTSFAGNGAVLRDLGMDDSGGAIAVQADGKIVVAASSDGRLVALRFLPDGSPDPSFGSGGASVVPGVSVSGSEGVTLVLQPDGRIVLSSPVTGGVAVARLNQDGSPDGSFAGGGVQQVTVPGSFSFSSGMALADDGRIVVAGYHNLGSQTELFALRLLPDGSPDSSFGSGGIASVGAPAVSYLGFAVAIQPNRRILVGGDFFDGSNDQRLLVRFLGDTQPPDTQITAGPKGRIRPRKKVSFSFVEVNDVHSSFECALQRPRRKRHHHHQRAAVFAPCTSPQLYRNIRRKGRYRFSVRATDPAGNVDASPATRSFKVRKRHRR